MTPRPQDTPVKVAILWHMHQPNYREPGLNRLSMPWVRLHALKDYLDMPLLSASFEKVKVTFNLVPSLLDQIDLYLAGAVDRHLELSRMPAEELPPALKMEILDTFFAANPSNMIRPHQRFWELYNKARRGGDGQKSILASLYSSAEIRDLQVWSNLAWVDPMFRDEEPIRSLFAKEKQYSEADKHQLLDWQLGLMARIVPTYKRLQDEGRIEVSLTPYYHPILPLLCDTNVAREALPDIKLPHKRFVHPEDAELQVRMSVERYEQIFGRPMKGMWPSEGSVSEEVLGILSRNGILWGATDEEILHQSLLKSNLAPDDNPLHTVYRHSSGVNLFFRDHGLSDRIGFVYSGWKAQRAVTDFISHIHEIRRRLVNQIDNVVIPVILDGENAWEYFDNDAHDFLAGLYQALNDDPLIETVTMTEAAEHIQSRPLPSLFAGSWINHNFRIWIGHEEDNIAWDLLTRTRDTLVEFVQKHPNYDPAKLAAAWQQVYIAEGSDWCWWYGDEHHSDHDELFDKTFRRHLAAVYDNLQLEIPQELLKPVRQGAVTGYLRHPENTITPTIDGRVSHFYEWTGAGFFDNLKAGGAMHQVNRYLAGLYFGYDDQTVFIRLDFHNKMGVDLLQNPVIACELLSPESKEYLLVRNTQGSVQGDEYRYAIDELVEFCIDRAKLFKEHGFGRLGVRLSLSEQGQRLESCPETEPLWIDIPEPNKEMFWPI
ncbi:MAG: glycoside hydrolase family 57 protein [Candidatus Zixiibacteriota bacterium]